MATNPRGLASFVWLVLSPVPGYAAIRFNLAEQQPSRPAPAKARRSRFDRPERGGGHGGAERRRARREGMRSGYGRPGGPGLVMRCGRGAAALPHRTLHSAKSILKQLLTDDRAAILRPFKWVVSGVNAGS